MSSGLLLDLRPLSVAAIGFRYCTQYDSLPAQVPVYGGRTRQLPQYKAPAESISHAWPCWCFLPLCWRSPAMHARPGRLYLSLGANSSWESFQKFIWILSEDCVFGQHLKTLLYGSFTAACLCIMLKLDCSIAALPISPLHHWTSWHKWSFAAAEHYSLSCHPDLQFA